jgi:hypothetical protein
MKSSKSNTKIPVVTKKLFLRHPRYDLSATLRRSSEEPFDFTMHYYDHREFISVLVNPHTKCASLMWNSWNSRDYIKYDKPPRAIEGIRIAFAMPLS